MQKRSCHPPLSPPHPKHHPHLQGEETLDGTFQSRLTKLLTKVLDLEPVSFREIKVALIEYSCISVKLATFYCWAHWAARGKCCRKVRGWEQVRMQSQQLILLGPEPKLFNTCLCVLSSRGESAEHQRFTACLLVWLLRKSRWRFSGKSANLERENGFICFAVRHLRSQESCFRRKHREGLCTYSCAFNTGK